VPFGLQEIGTTISFIGMWVFCYVNFMEPLPAHE
jgi:hypothetical protein